MYFRCDYDAHRRKKEQLKGENKGGKMDYRMGDAVEVVDGEACWSAKVLEIQDKSALVHFLKFNARHDEWIPLERIRRKEEYPTGSSEQKEFKVGERVMAPWKYGRKYPGVVIERQTNGYKVKFYDGVTVSVKPSTMRYLRKEEIPSEEEDDDEEESHTPSSGRRERKTKFNIKDLLSVRRRRSRKSSGVNDESFAGDEGDSSLLDEDNVDDEISFKIKSKPLVKKGAKEPEETKSANVNNFKSSKETLSEEQKVKKPPKKVESCEEKHKKLDSKAFNKLSRKSLKSFNKSSKFLKKQAVPSSVKKETKNTTHSSSTSSSKNNKSPSSSSLSSKSKEDLISSKNTRKNLRKPENSLRSSKSSENPKKDYVPKRNSKLSLRKNDDKSHKGSAKTSSFTKKVNDSEKENSKNSQCKKNESKTSSGSSKDSTFNSSIQVVKKDNKNVKEESESKKGCKRDGMPASELKDKGISNNDSTKDEYPPDEKNRSIKDKQEKNLEKVSDSNQKDNTEIICSVKNSTGKESKMLDNSKKTPIEDSKNVESKSLDKKEGNKKINGSTPVIKARITEPLLKEGPPIALVTGKRERKRKKFWDEEDESLSYAPPSKSSKKSGEISNRRLSSSYNPSVGVTENETGKNVNKSSSSSRAIKGKFKTEADVRGGNGKKLEYLLFDMNLEPNLIAKQMIEGYNIPGPGEPIPVDSSNLPDGWEKRVIQRGLGVTRGKWDVFIQNAAGKSFRSKTELQKHFDENHLNYSIDSFDFSLDDNLKRLRQIWKQYVIKPNLKPGEKLSSPVPAKFSRKALNAKHLKDSSVLSSLNAANLPSYLPRVQSSSTNSKIKDNDELSNINSRIPSPSCHDSVHQNSLMDTSLSPGVMSETGQGLRCKINNCGKLFRNDKLLLMHVKHYHPEFRDSFPPISCVPSTDGIDEDEAFSPALGGKRKSDASSFPVSAPPEKKLKTLLPEVDRRKTLSSNHDSINLSSGRKRNDSSLSVGSGCTTDGERAVSPSQPKYKSNQRKQFQLLNNKKCTFSTEEDGRCQDDSNSEMDASTTSADHLTSEEVVNCSCRRLEEDGLMIQCDLCLCWQHGACLGIFDEDQVPEKHVCSICKNPPGSRHPASRTQIDQDLLKEGKFASIPTTSSSLPSNDESRCLTSKQDAFRKLSDLMADLIGLSKILHSLRIKISVASQKNSSKVFMWSSTWIRPHQPPSKSQKEEKEIQKNKSGEMVEDSSSNQENMIIVEESFRHPNAIVNDSDSLVIGESELNGFKEELGDAIDPSMIPSVSEVQELLPSIIEAEGLLQGSQEVDFVTDQPPPIMPTIIPEPKRIDKDESRINLIQHIDDVQCEVEERLNILEQNLVRLEKDDENSESTIDDAVNADCAKTKAIIQMLLLDLSTGKTMLGSI